MHAQIHAAAPDRADQQHRGHQQVQSRRAVGRHLPGKRGQRQIADGARRRVPARKAVAVGGDKVRHQLRPRAQHHALHQLDHPATGQRRQRGSERGQPQALHQQEPDDKRHDQRQHHAAAQIGDVRRHLRQPRGAAPVAQTDDDRPVEGERITTGRHCADQQHRQPRRDQRESHQ
ncbi:hypothetical protein WR25_13760 [Diploscapter pachys]|uniref:Uncharacterized protein n=1 Tax=Diploscapter pachys TaxID=2018661 RepID=A0A2A2K469_9BILA|nr:hypothetical protein WR25_13760 [Diploscapter pachys]